MELIAAVDLRGGRVVRLHRGDFDRETVYADDPVAVAQRWAQEGAGRLHVVDLDGAVAGRQMQLRMAGRIVEAVDIPVQLAGGLRDGPAVADALAAGADRVVLGTALLERPGWAKELLAKHGEARVAAALDVRAGQAVGHGWGRAGILDALDALHQLREAGITIFAVTAIERDGTMQGPDIAMLEGIRSAAPDARMIASGGIRNVDDLIALRSIGMAGAILGTALYSGSIRLHDALAALTPQGER